MHFFEVLVARILMKSAERECRTGRPNSSARKINASFVGGRSGSRQIVLVEGWSKLSTSQLKRELGPRLRNVKRFRRTDVWLTSPPYPSKTGFQVRVRVSDSTPTRVHAVAASPELRRNLGERLIEGAKTSPQTYVEQWSQHASSGDIPWILSRPSLSHVIKNWPKGFIHDKVLGGVVFSSGLGTFGNNADFIAISKLLTTEDKGRAGVGAGDLVKRGINPVISRVNTGLQAPQAVIDRHLVSWVPGKRQLSTSRDWHQLSDAELHADSVVCDVENLWLYEAGASQNWDFVAGQSDSVFSVGLDAEVVGLFRKPFFDFEIPKAISLLGRVSKNWFHAIVEYLPRLIEADILFDPEIPFIANSDLPPAAKALIAELTPRKVIFLESNRNARSPQSWCRVGQLYFRSPTFQLTDSMMISHDEALLEVDSELLAKFRERVRSRFTTNPQSPNKVFFERHSYRSLSNQAELAQVAKRFGYEVIDPALLSLRDQMEVFLGARSFASAGGAVAANYLFLPEGSQITALYPKVYADFPHGAVMAAISGSTLTHVIGRSDTRPKSHPHKRDWGHSSFSVSPRVFEKHLSQTH